MPIHDARRNDEFFALETKRDFEIVFEGARFERRKRVEVERVVLQEHRLTRPTVEFNIALDVARDRVATDGSAVLAVRDVGAGVAMGLAGAIVGVFGALAVYQADGAHQALEHAASVQQATNWVSVIVEHRKRPVVNRIARVVGSHADAVRGRPELVLEIDDAAVFNHALADAAACDPGI